MSGIKAIETRYAGCRFRSRLEARWAVFFDTIGEPWEYEPQGFEVSSGKYLPDFYLPRPHRWIEVKPSIGAIGHDEWQRMQDFGNEVVQPADRFSILFSLPRPTRKPSPLIWTVGWVGVVPMWAADSRLVDSCGHVFAGFFPLMWACSSETRTAKGLEAARSARFEHGEAG